ncbi:hypothetical protein JCM19233_3532 [Vibrio astriarenae]|nr:hypothetical protein JCM19233_3532 [Vibrio sp. C7]
MKYASGEKLLLSDGFQEVWKYVDANLAMDKASFYMVRLLNFGCKSEREGRIVDSFKTVLLLVGYPLSSNVEIGVRCSLEMKAGLMGTSKNSKKRAGFHS